MGPELALALAAGGTGLQMIGQRQAAGERRNILNREMERANQTQQTATTKVLEEGRKFNPEARLQSMRDAEQSAVSQSAQDLGGGAAVNTPTAKGAVSADYLKAKADSAISEGNRLTAIAREVAKARAPSTMQNQEALRRANLTGDLGSMWSTMRNMGQAGQRDAEAVEDPWYGQLGKLASAVGSAAMMVPTAAPASAIGGLTSGSAPLGMNVGSSFWRLPGTPRIKFGT